MNPLTKVKLLQKINSAEASLGISDDASWHAKYKDSAYIYVGGIPFELTEGDVLAVFAQYGEVVDINLVRDKDTGKSKGFAFLAYEDQRSTILAVDNLNGAKVYGRIIRVDHVTKYKKKEEEEDEETEKQKKEARGVCYAFQKGECNRGAACKFSHDEQRNANTGWGDKDSKWPDDRSENPSKSWKTSVDVKGQFQSHKGKEQVPRSQVRDRQPSRAEVVEPTMRRKRAEDLPNHYDREPSDWGERESQQGDHRSARKLNKHGGNDRNREKSEQQSRRYQD